VCAYVCVRACGVCACVREVWCTLSVNDMQMMTCIMQHAVMDRLNRLAADRYDMGIIKQVLRYDKCLNFESDYVEMLVKVCTTTCIFVVFPIINTYFLIAKRSLLSGYPSYEL
jgi:hypothetical protein